MEKILIIDFGGQYNQLIARRVRECRVYCEVKPWNTPLEELKAFDPIGIIFTGGPRSVYREGSPTVDRSIFTWGVPILGICYGCQLMARLLGGQVVPAQDDSAREYGKTATHYDTACKLFQGLGTICPGCRRALPSPPIAAPAPTRPSPTRPGGFTASSFTQRSAIRSTA